MRLLGFLGLTPWRVFLILWAAFCVTVSFALTGHHWAVVVCNVTEYVVFGIGVAAFTVVYALKGWQALQERKRGETQ